MDLSRSHPTRREFIADSAGVLSGAWLWLSMPSLGALAGCARDAARNGQPFRTFTAEEGAALRAFAARIIPSDATLPGAEEAGAAWFADAAIATHFPEMADPVRSLLADLDRRAGEAHGQRFAALEAARQDEIIAQVEQDPAFFPARMLVIAGVFADPSHGGNRDGTGWQILGYRPESAYQPPFGYYDAAAASTPPPAAAGEAP